MTPSQNDDQLADSPDETDEEPSRSLFRARWFRVVLVVLGVAAIAAVALPYVVDYVSPPRKPPAVAKSAPAPVTTPQPAPPPVTPAPATTPAPAPVSPPSQSAQTATPRPAPGAPAAPEQKKSAPVTTTEKSTPSESEAPAKAAKPPRSAKAIAKASESSAGAYWVQVGAFRDPEAAKRLAASLRQQSFNVSESMTNVGAPAAASTAPSKATPPPAASSSIDRYDVYVTGSSPADLSAKLGAKGLSVESSGDSVVVRPSLPLRDAVALSKDLATEGLKVQVKRARGANAPSAAAPAITTPAPATNPESLHRVRVGAFADRAAAEAAVRELEAKGFKPFIARGRE